MFRQRIESQHQFSAPSPSITTIKVLGLKIKPVSGVEEQHHHPIVIRKDSLATDGTMMEAALFGLIHGYNSDSNIALFTAAGNEFLEYSLEGKGEINMPGGWGTDRNVFELELEIQTAAFNAIEVITGFIDGDDYYPQRHTTKRLASRYTLQHNTHPIISSQAVVVYDPSWCGPLVRDRPNIFSLTPADLAAVADRMSLVDLQNDYIDTRQLINASPQVIDNSVASIAGYVLNWQEASKRSRFELPPSMADLCGMLARRHHASRASAFMRYISAAKGLSCSFTLADVFRADDGFEESSIVVLEKDPDNSENMYRVLDMGKNLAMAQHIRNILNPLQQGSIDDSMKTHTVVVRGRMHWNKGDELTKHGEGIISIPDGMYGNSFERERVEAELIRAAKNIPLWVEDITIKFRLNGNTEVFVKANSEGYAALKVTNETELYTIPTYAAGLISPLLTTDMKGIEPIAKVFERLFSM